MFKCWVVSTWTISVPTIPFSCRKLLHIFGRILIILRRREISEKGDCLAQTFLAARLQFLLRDPLRFAPNNPKMLTTCVILAAMDFNGGISVIDCKQVLQPVRGMNNNHFSHGSDSSRLAIIANPCKTVLNDRNVTMIVVSSMGKHHGMMHAT